VAELPSTRSRVLPMFTRIPVNNIVRTRFERPYETNGSVNPVVGSNPITTPMCRKAVNTVVKPILFVLTLPFTILTLGLFLFVLNAICLWITALLVPGFDVVGAWTTLLASLILAAVGMIWKAATSSS